MKLGSLVIVGSGIMSISHLTVEAQAAVRQSDIVLYCVTDPCTEYWIRSNGKEFKNLSLLYDTHKPRAQTYLEMETVILDYVRNGFDTCVLFYGHPGVFVTPTHKALTSARAEGFQARMCAAVSTIDCIVADLGINPATHGLKALGASDLLLRQRKLHCDEHLILLQVGMLGNPGATKDAQLGKNLILLRDYLLAVYPPGHRSIHYRAAQYAPCDPHIEAFDLSALGQIVFWPTSTLYLPPVGELAVDGEMAERMGLQSSLSCSSDLGPPVPEAPQNADIRQLLEETTVWNPHTPLTEYLADISQDLKRLDALKQVPESALHIEAGLSREEITALLSRKSEAVQNAIVSKILSRSRRES